MISRRQLPELRAFETAEQGLPLRSSAEYSTLVVPNGNASSAGHRWFKYKEAFSAQLLVHLFQDIKDLRRVPGDFKMLDPYCGVATGLLSAQLSDERIESKGIECNPFSAFVAQTKLAWPKMSPEKIRSLAKGLLARPIRREIALPALSSIRSGRCITRNMARQVVAFRDALAATETSPERDALVVGLASIIEPISRIRRDGRALRIVKKKRRTVFRTALAERWNAIADDVETLQKECKNPGVAAVIYGDGRKPDEGDIGDETIDLIFTSPPYPNNIDYNEVYKLELWFMGFAQKAEQFLGLRKDTYRSHPSCRELDAREKSEHQFAVLLQNGPLADIMRLILRRAERLEKECHRGRSRVLLGYVYDTWKSLQAHLRVLRPGGHAVYVLGNSLHGATERPYLVPTDLIFAQLARHVGFRVREIIIARGLRRRLAGNHFLRDSIVVLQKDQN